MDILRLASLFLKLSVYFGDIQLEVMRAFPPDRYDVYPPTVKATDDPNILYGPIDDNYGLKVEIDGGIVDATEALM